MFANNDGHPAVATALRQRRTAHRDPDPLFPDL